MPPFAPTRPPDRAAAADAPPRKKARSEASTRTVTPQTSVLELDLEPQASALQQRPRTRGVSACETCRSRKTRCDNQRPACGYCVRIGAPCNYAEDENSATLCNGVGPQLLKAIENLTGLLQQQQESQRLQLQATSATPLIVDDGRSPASVSTSWASHPSPQQPGLFIPGAHSHGVTNRPHNPPGGRLSATAGLQSIFEWSIFPKSLQVAIFHVDSEDCALPSHPFPSIELTELVRLEAKFVAYVHPKNPILDLSHLHQLVESISENGFDWSADTCLVALVCALGAISQRYTAEPSSRFTEIESRTQFENDSRLASKYWGVAVKRLGFVIGVNNLMAVQCLCLTGIWHMYNMRPLQAWRYFNLASNAWYTASMVNGRQYLPANGDRNENISLTLEQSLYFTCYKSECELTYELPLPESVLANIDYPYSFPSPPNLDSHTVIDAALESQRRTWYYYLAEIACRHLFNRIVHAQAKHPPLPTVSSIRRMFNELEIFEMQLGDWYSSLPPSLTFAIPSGKTTPLPDELSQYIRGRYLAIRELIRRPFVRLCTSHPLDIPPDMLDIVAETASQCLQQCYFHIESLGVNRHHGLWFQLRTFTTTALILVAADRAARLYGGTLNAAGKLIFPSGWKESILEKKAQLAPYYTEHSSVADYAKVLDWGLNDFK